jgi:hypothetical protein
MFKSIPKIKRRKSRRGKSMKVWSYYQESDTYSGIHENSLANLTQGPKARKMKAEAIREQLLTLCAEGLRISDIVKRTGLGGSTVYRYLQGCRKPLSRREIARSMLVKGASINDVIASTGLKKRTVQVYVWEMHRDPTIDVGINIIDPMLL